MTGAQPAGFRIDWDMGEGKWRFTSGARQVVLSGVARLEHPEQGERSFVPVFRRPARRGGADDPSTQLARTDSEVGLTLGVLSPFGLVPEPHAPLEWDGERVRLQNAGADLSRSEYAYAYERRGEVVVTPWTVDLGPVGLVPVRADPAAVSGTYVSGNEEFVVSTQRRPLSPSEKLSGGYDMGILEPGNERWCQYAPDARGLVFWNLGDAHPAMGHWDKPSDAFCFALGDGRVVRYLSSRGCGGMSPARLDVFQRRAP
jgi:hypothetical protein